MDNSGQQNFNPDYNQASNRGKLKFRLLLMATIIVIGLAVLIGLHSAASGPGTTQAPATIGTKTSTTIYFSPSSGSYRPGASLQVDVRADSHSVAVNTAQVWVSYPADKLQFQNLTEGTAYSGKSATDVATPGWVKIGRYVALGKSAIGDQVIASLHFHVLPGSGPAALAFDRSHTFVVRSADSQNDLTDFVGASYDIR